MACLSAIHTVYFFLLILVQQQCDREVSKKLFLSKLTDTKANTRYIHMHTTHCPRHKGNISYEYLSSLKLQYL